MSVAGTSLPDELLIGLGQLIDEEFINEEQAIEELLSIGMDAYGISVDGGDGVQSDFVQSAQNNLFDTTGDPGDLGDDVL